uniref:Eukaryotic translation initiation factor 4 gamma, 1a n=1 Tax=Cyprinus carpio TaxID=7962 RepID=A0A8C2ATT4_CYPCA
SLPKRTQNGLCTIYIAPRVQPSSTPRSVAPTHVYQPTSQVMMIPQQQLQFANTQGHAIFLHGQYRTPYMPPTQQYSAGFYPASSPAEYGTYAAAYYPATQQYPTSVSTTPVIMNSPQQQPAPPPQQIRIRDPNQGGRDITEEIMSGGRTTSTPTPPQVSVSTPPPSKTPEQAPVASLAADSKPVPEIRPASPVSKIPIPPEEDPEISPALTPSPPPASDPQLSNPQTGDSVDAPVLPDAPVQKEEPEDAPPVEPTSTVVEKEESEVAIEKEPEPVVETEAASEVSSLAAIISSPVEPPPAVAKDGEVASKDTDPLSMETPVLEPVVDEPKEQPLLNGLTEDSAEAPVVKPESSTNPDAEQVVPQVLQSCLMAVEAPVEEAEQEKAEETPAPVTVCPEYSCAFINLLYLFQPEEEKPAPEPEVAQKEPSPAPTPAPPPEESDETWEDKEDKLDTENTEPEASKLVEQKYQYKEEQWKPINPEEKKRYDREFLLGFQFKGASMHKPEGLPHISDVVLDKANKTPLRPLDPRSLMNCGPDFTPSYANLGRPSSGGGGRGPSARRPQPGRGKDQMNRNPKIITSLSLKDNVELNQAENAWTPSVKKQVRSRGVEEDEEETEAVKTQELFRRVRSVLNKLTPQMFQQLMKQVTELTIDTEERLKGVIDLIFEKAISEPNFSVAYANMCRCLMGLKVPTSDKPGVTVNFRKLLLNRCQKEFEKDKDDDEIFEQKQKELDAAAEEEERQRLKEELEEAKDKARRRSLGNIKFIGELFKLKMLTEPIMHDCIVKLLKNHDEESLECLCRLLSTIGKDLDFEKAKPRMDQYFHQMEKITKEKKTSSRIRFMLQDVLDLRKSNWVPRRGDQGPKTIDQIHKEAEMEEHREQVKVQQQLLSKKDSSQGRGGRGGPHSSGGRGSQTQDEGWNIVPITTKSRPIDTSRLSKITKVRLCDGFFSVLELKPMSAPAPPPPVQAKPALSEDELDKKSKSIIEEYLHINDMKEALQCVQELNSASLLFVFVRNGVESTLERSTIAREHVGLLFQKLVSARILPPEQYYKGLQEILEIADDMAIDIPHIWLYLAEIITPMLQEGGIPMGQLFSVQTSSPYGQSSSLFFFFCLCSQSHKKAGVMWLEAGLSWKDFLPEDEDVNKFVTEQKMEFTLGEEPEKPSKKELTAEELSKHLDRLLQEKANNQRIYDWVEANLDEQMLSSNQFVRALMMSVCQSAIICENPYKVDVVQITQRAKLLQKYLSDETKELQALYALQALMVQMEQPANLLRMFFDALYDEDVIKEDAFYKWESSKDPAEQLGKGVALKSVTAFFTWLREAESESDNS